MNANDTATPTTFAASVSCDNCGHRSDARLSVARHAIHMHDGRRVVAANGRIKCPGCGSRHMATYRTEECGDDAERAAMREVARA